jgi:hypothetical protein
MGQATNTPHQFMSYNNEPEAGLCIEFNPLKTKRICFI